MKLFNKIKHNFPEFWDSYGAYFAFPLPEIIQEVRFVVLDTETTGLQIETDRILSIGALALQNNSIAVEDSMELFLDQHFYHSGNIQIHGILRTELVERLTEIEALQRFLKFIGNSVLVGHHIGFDIAMINLALKRHGLPKLKNKTLDTSILYKRTLIRSNLIQVKEHYGLDELADKFDIPKKDRHTALGDAYITALLFLKIMSKLKLKKAPTLSRLLRL